MDNKPTRDERHEEDHHPPPRKVVGEDSPFLEKTPIPAVRKRRIMKTAVESSSSVDDTTQPYVSQGQIQQDYMAIKSDSNEYLREKTSTVTKTTKKTIKMSTASSQEYLVEEYESPDRPKTPSTPSRLKQKAAIYEKFLLSGEGGIKRTADHLSTDSIDEYPSESESTGIAISMDTDNPFDIDVYEIEKRLREERKRGLAEAEAAKLAFQQIQLRSTPNLLARKVEIQEQHTASPFNVTLKTTSKITPGDVIGRIELEEHSPKSPFNVTLRTTQRYCRNPQVQEEKASSPFNVTLRTTKKPSSSPNPVDSCSVDGKVFSARFLDGERTVREVKAVDGITTIVTSSMTSDGRKHEEKIFRHGEGYFSPRSSPQRETRATTPSRSVDMTAGGRRILIKLENESEQIDMYSTNESFDVTDYKVTSERHLMPTAGNGENVTLETPANIDIIVGTTSNHPKRHTINLETKHEQMPWQTQQHTHSHSTYTTKTTTKITTTSHQQEHSESLAGEESPLKTDSLLKTIKSHSSTAPEEESHRFVTKKSICIPSTSDSSRIDNTETTTTSTHKLLKLDNKTIDYEHDALKKRLEIVGYGREGLGRGTGELGSKADQSFRSRDHISDDSDTEGTAASSIVIVPTTFTTNLSSTPPKASEEKHNIFTTNIATTASTGNGTLTKSLTPTQIQQHQSTSSSNEYQEIQSTMAAIQYARSNSQYDTHIKEKREEQERVQKKTFTNWINSYLSKRVPPLRVDDLINDLRDGTKLIALLEVLSGEKLPVEKGRVLRRPHFLSNANTALQYLASKRIKLVNINPADLVDGRPPVVLGLIWTIILYFQIEENSRNLEYLGHGIGGSVSSLDSVGKNASDVKAEKWKQGARKTLLNWVTNALPKESGVEVKDFGASWRDGVAFLALIDSIKANLVNLAELKKTNNRHRLETAFDVAESKLGIAKLLDAEDVDVPKPDEKSIMTYVAQFLHKYPEPKGASKDFSHIQQEIDELRRFLLEKSAEYEPMVMSNSFPRDFAEYLIAQSEIDAHLPTYNRLKQLVESQSGFLQVSRAAWEDINILWQRVQYQMMYWLWLLDSELPGEFGEVGKWLAEAEKILMDNDIPTAMNEETAAIISRKLEEHKLFFADLPRILAMFENAKRSPLAQKVPLEQLRNMERRLQELGPKAAERRIKLKFLEHKCCLVAFLNLVENKMKGWTGKYGTEEKVAQQLEQYKNFVSRNKIFQEFQKAFVDMQQVVEEYKRDGNVSRKEIIDIDRFMYDTEERWKRVSMELKCCQNSLEEVVNCWKTWQQLVPDCENWLNLAEQKVMQSEDEKLVFFQDISIWKDKFDALANAANYLIASCEENIAQNIRQHHNSLSDRFERMFANTKKYMHAGDIIRSRQEYKTGIEKLSQWLRSAENILSQKLELGDNQQIQSYSENLQKLASEIDANEELFKTISRNIQGLIQDLSREEVDGMMKTLKQEKEALVRVRAQIPNKLHLIHQLLIQQESLEAGQNLFSVY